MRRTSAGVLVVLALLSGAGGFLLDHLLTASGRITFTPSLLLPVLLLLIAAASLGDVSQVLTGAFTMVSLLWLPAILWSIANDDLYQGWHDHAAGTFVVDR